MIMMELKEFFRLRKMGIFILNQSLKYLNPSDYATDDLILLLYFPSHKVHRKVIKLLKKHPSLKFVSISKIIGEISLQTLFKNCQNGL